MATTSDDMIPRDDRGALDWMNNLAAKLSASPGVYAIGEAELANLQAVVEAYATALAVTLAPDGRNPGSTTNKDMARGVAARTCRQAAAQIRVNGGITPQEKIDAGIRPPRQGAGQPTDPPTTSPTMTIVGATPGSQTLQYADSMTPHRRAKPGRNLQLQLFMHVGPAATKDADAARYQGSYTRGPIGVGFDPADDGAVATYFARWVDNRGRAGPWSLPVSMRIAA